MKIKEFAEKLKGITEEHKFINNLISFITVIAVGVTTLLILSNVDPSSRINTNEVKEEIKQEIKAEVKQEIKEEREPSEFPDYDLLSNFKSFVVTTNTKGYVKDQNNILGRIKKNLHAEGLFGRIYIFIEASVDNGKPLSIYDDIYLTFNFEGGHILPADSLPVPPGKISKLLYGAESLPSSKKTLDVIEIFNTNEIIGIDMFLSTARVGGEIHNFVIYYECGDGSQECEIH